MNEQSVRKPLVIVGAGGHGRVVADAAYCQDLTIAGFIDDSLDVGTAVVAGTVLGGTDLMDDPAFISDHDFVVALGDQQGRMEWVSRLDGAGASLAIVRHPATTVSPWAEIGAGSMLIAGSVINVGARIGRACIINTGATVDHDCLLGDGVQLCPGVHLAGTVTCGAGVFIGTGASVIPNIRIGEGATVGAGSVVIEDVAAGTTVVGCPAQPA